MSFSSTKFHVCKVLSVSTVLSLFTYMYLYVSRHVVMYFLFFFLLQISKSIRTREREREKERERERIYIYIYIYSQLTPYVQVRLTCLPSNIHVFLFKQISCLQGVVCEYIPSYYVFFFFTMCDLSPLNFPALKML